MNETYHKCSLLAMKILTSSSWTSFLIEITCVYIKYSSSLILKEEDIFTDYQLNVFFIYIIIGCNWDELVMTDILKKQMTLLNGVIICYFCLSINFQLNVDGVICIHALNCNVISYCPKNNKTLNNTKKPLGLINKLIELNGVNFFGFI